MKNYKLILTLLGIVLVNVLAQFAVLRIDLTQDKRHTLSVLTKQQLSCLGNQIEVEVYLQGSLNSGFTRLHNAVKQLLNEMSFYGNISCSYVNPNDLDQALHNSLDEALLSNNLHPTAIYEADNQASRKQTIVYPFALVRYQGREKWVNLLTNRRDLSGAENLNNSIETLEYRVMSAIISLMQVQREKVVFLEGHGELNELRTQDVQKVLAEHFDIYRGQLTTDADCLEPFSAVIIADPQLPFTEADKYIIDQYLMNGGRLLWFVSGVQFSEQVLQDEGYTPTLILDLNITDMLFKYGIRINNHLLQDLQCLSVPIDVSGNPEQPQWQPMPFTFAPLLLTSNSSPITYNLSPVSATFCSDISIVGNSDQIEHNILLASSEYSRLLPVPSEVNLGDLQQDPRHFTQSYLPVADALEGNFPSLFAHRMKPEGINSYAPILVSSVPTKQIVVASGSVVENDIHNGQPLPAGYDSYSRIQFSNRDFVLNSVLWLTDHTDLLNLRKKDIPLRMLNKEKVRNSQSVVLSLALGLPLVLLLLTAGVISVLRTRKYTK